MRITSGEELEEIVRRGAEAGWPVAVHAIGDRANREALDAFEATRDAWRPLGLRQRIEHAQCLAPEDVPRFAALGVACSVQFSHAPSDRDLADRLWAERLDGAYAFRSLLESGAVVANGSDAPVEELDPLAGIAAGVLRTIDDRPAWQPEEALTVEQALTPRASRPRGSRATSAAAAGCCPGLLADLVVLDRDPLAVEPEELREIRSSRRWSAAAGCTTRRPGTEYAAGRRGLATRGQADRPAGRPAMPASATAVVANPERVDRAASVPDVQEAAVAGDRGIPGLPPVIGAVPLPREVRLPSWPIA